MSEKKSRNLPKEKFVTIYETFFKAEDFSAKPICFWDELFLIKLNSNYIINEFKNLSSNEDLIKLKKNINFLYNKAIEYLKVETNLIRLHNIIHTLYLFTYSISVTKQIKLNSIETLEFLVGISNAEAKFQIIFDAIYTILTNDEGSSVLKTISLRYLLALATQVENVNDNLFMEYFMLNNGLFEAIIQIVSNSTLRRQHGRDAVLLLTILLQYRKYESENPYIVKLSILDDEMALTGLAAIMSSVFAEYNRVYSNNRKEQEGESSWWNNVGTMIGNMFIGDEEKRRALRLEDSILLVFYESVHLNRNFISALTHAATEFTSGGDQQQSMNTSNSSPTATSAAAAAVVATVPSTPTATSAPVTSLTAAPANTTSSIATSQNMPLELDLNNMRLLNPHSSLLSATTPGGGVGGVGDPSSIIIEQLEATQPNDPPSNLLVIFLQACSAILQETKIETNNVYDTIKLFMLVLVCISEDQYANSILHDSNVLYSVFLYQAKLRHRKLNMEKVPPSRQLACSVLDLMIEFVQSHLMKNFPFELYLKSIGIIQRLMCYQKKYRIRLDYNWQNLWNSLINTLKFVINYESTLLSKGHNLFLLYSRIIVIFNIFITYGDSFLPNAESYDYLYYDILRMRQVFDNLMLLLNRYVSTSEYKEHVIRLINQMSNIKSILSHFTPKIDAWSTANHVSSLTEQQVLEIVRSNYETLTLKLEDDLDQYERYVERPFEASYFATLGKRIVNETRASISDVGKFDTVNILSLSVS